MLHGQRTAPSRKPAQQRTPDQQRKPDPRVPGQQRIPAQPAAQTPVDDRAGGQRAKALAAVLEADPLLRLHCAIATGSPPVTPWPPHPGFPSGTRVTSIADFVAGARGSSAAGPNEQQLIEFVVRPIATVFRVALDRYGLVLDTDPRRLAIEIGPRRQATGRVVVGGLLAAGLSQARLDPAGIDRTAVDAAAYGLARCLDLLSSAIARGGSEYARLDRVRTDLDRTLGAELRFLNPNTVDLLRGAPLLGRHAHSVSQQQERTLARVLDRVEQRARARRAAPHLRPPAVLLDLDHVVLTPRARTLHATRAVCGPRAGAARGIRELCQPEHLPLLPTYHPDGWRRFLDATGLPFRYPPVDFDELLDEFRHAYFRPWENLAWDDLTPGVGRFIHDIGDRGGVVVFTTARRERVRQPTEAALARGGLLGLRLLMLPDDRDRPVAESKVGQLLGVGDLDVVAVFDDLTDNRAALSRALPDALMVPVALPGFAADSEPPNADADLVETFERSARPTGPPYDCTLSHTRSVADLQAGELSTRPVTANRAVYLSDAASRALVDRLLQQALSAADETVDRALRWARQAVAGPHSDQERTVRLVHHQLTRKQFRRGSHAAYPLATAAADITASVAAGRPIDVVVPSFPVKHAESGLKAFGTLPDLAELAVLIRLRELHAAVSGVYPPGLRITLLTDGQHFRSRPRRVTSAYLRRLSGYLGLIGVSDLIRIVDIDEAFTRWYGPAAQRERAARLASYQSIGQATYGEIAIAEHPYRAIDRARRLDPWGNDLPVPHFVDMFASLIHAVPVATPRGYQRMEWSRLLYADLYNVGDAVPPELAAGRRAILRAAWDNAIGYVSVMRADRIHGYDRILSPRVRLTFNTPEPGRCGFAGLGGSAVLPWHGTAAVDPRGHVSTDFALALCDRAFVPVYSPLLGAGQPFFMAPITMTPITTAPITTATTTTATTTTAPIAPAPISTGRLTDEFLARVRLRRR